MFLLTWCLSLSHQHISFLLTRNAGRVAAINYQNRHHHRCQKHGFWFFFSLIKYFKENLTTQRGSHARMAWGHRTESWLMKHSRGTLSQCCLSLEHPYLTEAQWPALLYSFSWNPMGTGWSSDPLTTAHFLVQKKAKGNVKRCLKGILTRVNVHSPVWDPKEL